MATENQSITHKKWLGIGLYMLIALAFSYYFRIAPPDWYKALELPVWLAPFQRLLGALGIFLGALVAQYWFGTSRRITVAGSYPKQSWLMILFPILLFTVLGVSTNGLNAHMFGFLVGLQAALWVFLEEYGWRGYLQNELHQLSPLRRYLIIGVLWYVWHLWFLRLDPIADPSGFAKNLTVGFAIILAGSWGLGVVADTSRSVLVAGCFHMLGSFVQFNPIITENVEQRTRWIIFAICLAFWMFMVMRWPKADQQTAAS